MIAALVFVVLIAVAAVPATIATVVLVHRDGYRRIPARPRFRV